MAWRLKGNSRQAFGAAPESLRRIAGCDRNPPMRCRPRLRKLGAEVVPISPYFDAENNAKIAASESHGLKPSDTTPRPNQCQADEFL